MAAAGNIKISPTIKYRYIVADVTNLPFKDNEFDSIVDVFGLEYV